MSYPGNASLTAEIQQRVLDTFQQSLELASAGKRDEALLGCDFILRLDSLFEAARTLQVRLREGGDAIDVADLERVLSNASAPSAAAPVETAAAAATPPEAGEAFVLSLDDDTDLSNLDLSDLDLPDLPEPDEMQAVAAEPAAGETAPAVAAPPDAITPPVPTALDASAAADEPAISLLHEPMAELDSESEQRITDLLGEGQNAFESRDYQGAIDAWSRIFLIDIDHAEANRRIEMARKLKAEVERKVEAAYHDGISQLEGGQMVEARAAFIKVLEIQPSHLAAKEYLEKIDAGEFVSAQPEPAAHVPMPTPEAVVDDALPDIDDHIPPPPTEAPAEPIPVAETAPLAAEPAKTGPRKSFLYIAAAVLLVVVLGTLFLLTRRDRMFPNADEQVTAALGPDPIARAQRLHDDGKAPMAIAQLKRIPATDPNYDSARALITQWEMTLAESDAPEEAASPEELARRDELLAGARDAYADRQYLRARALFDQATVIAPLEGTAAELRADADRQLSSIAPQIAQFEQGDWEYALRELWRAYDSDPGNRDAKQLIVDSYYNLAVRDLQRNDTVAAADKFDEALALAPDDPEIARLLDFAETYNERDEDLLYRTFVKYLHFRG